MIHIQPTADNDRQTFYNPAVDTIHGRVYRLSRKSGTFRQMHQLIDLADAHNRTTLTYEVHINYYGDLVTYSRNTLAEAQDLVEEYAYCRSEIERVTRTRIGTFGIREEREPSEETPESSYDLEDFDKFLTMWDEARKEVSA